MPRAPTTGIRLTPEDVAILEALATAEGRTKGDVIRRALRMYAAANLPASKTPKRPKR